MTTIFNMLLYGTIFLIGIILFRVFRGPSLYDRLNGIFMIGLNVVVVIVLVGFIDGRADMYVDIAISYGVLGFISTVLFTKFLAGGGK
ncbi:multicomponent Na+:H+ antiporter subunit F [Clostridiales Family XIII bacterium PM5-7]